jgi:molecular chaperone HscB
MRFYDALELRPPKLGLDAADLQERFYRLSRQWHPDRFSRAGADQQQQALERTAVLNDAFRTLRDPVARAEYFLREHDLEPSSQPPPELLEEVFELNMALDALRGGEEAVRGQLTEAEGQFRTMLADIDRSLEEMFVRYDDASGRQGGEGVLVEMRAALDRRRYIANLVREVEKELHVHVPN